MKKLLSALVAVAFALSAVAEEKAAPPEKPASAEKAAPAKKESKKKTKKAEKKGADSAIVPSK